MIRRENSNPLILFRTNSTPRYFFISFVSFNSLMGCAWCRPCSDWLALHPKISWRLELGLGIRLSNPRRSDVAPKSQDRYRRFHRRQALHEKIANSCVWSFHWTPDTLASPASWLKRHLVTPCWQHSLVQPPASSGHVCSCRARVGKAPMQSMTKNGSLIHFFSGLPDKPPVLSPAMFYCNDKELAPWCRVMLRLVGN